MLTNKFPGLTIVSLFLLTLMGCGGDEEISLTVTNCPVEDISLHLIGQSEPMGSGRWALEAEVLVKCRGVASPGAEIEISFWWPGGTFNFITNSAGRYKDSRTVNDNPSGKEFSVRIVGSDSEKTESFTYP